MSRFFTEDISINTRDLVTLLVPGVALSVWMYNFTFGEVIGELITKFDIQGRVIYAIILFSLAFSAIITGILIDKTKKSLSFVYAGLVFCGFVSLLALLINSSNQFLLFSVFAGFGSGIGITAFRVYMADVTEVEERGRIAGVVLFASYIAIVVSKIILRDASFTTSILFLSGICFLGLSIYLSNPKKIKIREKSTSDTRSARLFLISWILITLAYGVWNALITPHPITLVSDIDTTSFIILSSVGYAIAAIIGGISTDWIGRKLVVGFALAALAMAYAFYGLISSFVYPALFLEVTAWGFLNTIFLFVLWGDLSSGSRGLFYGVAWALFFGGLIFGETLAYLLGPTPWSHVSLISSTLLILAILPILKVEEPLPKEKIKEREMSRYLKEVRKIGRK
ncbi:MAG: MFS transporter [Thermodesulfobacteriota bacterium]